MNDTDRDKERKLCREFYERWDFIKKIVELYTEGVAWKGCKLIAHSDTFTISPQYSQIIDNDSIKDGVRNMLIDGIGTFNIKLGDSIHELSIPTQKESSLADAEPGGRSFLWAAARQDEHLNNLFSIIGQVPPQNVETHKHLLDTILNSTCSVIGVPYILVSPKASTTDPYIIMDALATFNSRVKELRRYISFQLRELSKPFIFKFFNYEGPIEIRWNEFWFPQYGEYGPVYQVFKAQGIDLITLSEQMLNHEKQMYEMNLISKDTY